MWYPNGYGNQPAIAQEGATVGGWFTLRIVVQPQSGYILNATVTSATLAEQTSAHAVTPGNPQFQVSSTRYPGDPHSNVIILESLQNLADKHNGQYRVEFSVSYTVSTGSPPPNDRRTFTESGSFTFNALNLVLVDSRSESYVVWKPDQMSGIGFSAQLVHAQNGTCTVKLEIFRSDDNQNPVLVREFANVPRPGTWYWIWDGKLDDGSTAPRGIYLYRLSAYVYGSAPPDRDSNRSDFIQTVADTIQCVDDNGCTATYRIWYTLTSTQNRPASQGQIQVYDPTLDVYTTYTLNLSDLTAGSHAVTLTIPSPTEAGRYIFLLQAQDNHRDLDKAHRLRDALPHNQQRAYSALIAYSHGEFNSQSKYFVDGGKALGFKKVPGYDWWYGNPWIRQMRGPLEYYDPAIGRKPLKIVFFSGHSHTDLQGKALLMKGPAVLPDWGPEGSQKWLVTCYADWNAIPGLRGRQDCLIVESIGGPGQTLTNLELVVLAGCGLVAGVQTGGLSDWFLYKGAKTAVTIGYIEVYSNAVCVYLDGYGGGENPKVPGFMQRLKNNTVYDAYMEALTMTQDWAKDTYASRIFSPAKFDAKFQGDATLRVRP